MTDARRADTLVLDAALAPPSRREVRAAAASAIGQLRATQRVVALRTLIADSDTAVAANAAYALGLLRDTAGVSALGAALASRPRVAVEAAWALGEIGEPSRREILTALGARREAEVVRELLLAAAKLRPVPVEAIVPHLGSSDDQVQWAAAYAIARPRAAAGTRALLPLANARSAEVRAQVASALRLTMTGDSLSADALRALGVLVRHSNPHVRINAVRSLATHGAAGNAGVVAAIADPDANVRIATAQSLGLAGVRDDATWGRLLAADTTLAFRRGVLESAARAGIIRPELRTMARHADWRERAAAASAGGAASDVSKAGEILFPLGRDSDARVREAAVSSIAAYPDSTSPAWRRDSLRAQLLDRDDFVRAAALGGLQAGARAREVPVILAAYRAAARDSSNDARLAALRVVVAAWRSDSAGFPDSLRAVIRALPAPHDGLERAEGHGVSLFSAWPGAEGRSRSQDWYADLVERYVIPAAAGDPPRATIVTSRGSITLELFGAEAPWTVANFVLLARAGFYANTRFHRVVPNFVAQDGDPRGNGSGGPGYAIRDEINRHRYGRGVLGMALSGPHTGGSQYFITHSPQPHLDGRYTVFGRVVDGLRVLDAIVEGDVIQSVVVP